MGSEEFKMKPTSKKKLAYTATQLHSTTLENCFVVGAIASLHGSANQQKQKPVSRAVP